MAKKITTAEEVEGKYVILCPEQGVSIGFDNKPEFKKWIQGELDFWVTNVGTFNQLIVVSIGLDPQIGTFYQTIWQTSLNRIETMRSVSDLSALADEIGKNAKNYGMLFSSSPIMVDAIQLHQQGDVQSATLSICIHTKLHHVKNANVQRELGLARYLTYGNLHSTGFKHSLAAQILRNDITKLHEENAVELENSRGLYQTSEQELKRVNALFRTKLGLEAPASYWTSMKRWAVFQWIVWLIVFVCLIAAPFVLVWFNWVEFDLWFKQLITDGGGSFSVTALVVVTIPVVAYGWVLKHVSRLFVRAVDNSADAKFRSMFATTFLSLADQTDTLTQEDKAIVLNALFRPPANGSRDDGPPAGVVELLRKDGG